MTTPYDQGYAAARPNQGVDHPPNPYPAGSPDHEAFNQGAAGCVREWQNDNDRERMQSKHGRW